MATVVEKDSAGSAMRIFVKFVAKLNTVFFAHVANWNLVSMLNFKFWAGCICVGAKADFGGLAFWTFHLVVLRCLLGMD